MSSIRFSVHFRGDSHNETLTQVLSNAQTSKEWQYEITCGITTGSDAAIAAAADIIKWASVNDSSIADDNKVQELV